ncbi:MAG: CRTAC1 family protein [Saprospiraceae bacterium]|nr:CRTAC1 family protein [Saprospiraceae bacterium]
MNCQDHWNELAVGRDFFSGIPVSCADVNGDAIDDLLILDQGKKLWLGLNNGFGYFLWEALPYHELSPAWSVNVADIDRNGFNDILISGENTRGNILYQFQNGFVAELFDAGFFLSQAACIFDIDQDGWLDFTLCDDNSATRIYRNNQLGKLYRDTSILNLNLPDLSKTGGNYGCIWSDFDWDGDPDLYISKCRPGVTDPTDLRRVNLFYLKDSTQWIEKAKDLGLNIGDQSWISVFEDFDNDGALDVFVLNHYTPSRLFKQKSDHTFEDITNASGLNSNAISIQAMAMDFDNDGDIDILLVGTAVELWVNEGNMKFVKSPLTIGDKPFTSCASGDYNRDGWLDLYVTYSDLLNTPNNQKDKIWLNPGGLQHYVKFSFQGTRSNTNGIGTKIKLYANNTLQVRELHAGESFGIQNSLNLQFGLNQATNIDSIIVFWPSGSINRFYNLNSNAHYLVSENNCLVNFNLTSPTIEIPFCNSIDTFLIANTNLHNIYWNSGLKDSILAVKKEGIYYYKAYDQNTCPVISNPYSFVLNPKQKPKLNIQYSKILCEGEYLELTANPADKLQWSSGEFTSKIQISKPGNYFAIRQGYCELESSDTLNVGIYKIPNTPIIKPDTLYFKREAILQSKDTNLYWYNEPTAIVPAYVGPIYKTDTIRNSRSFWVEQFETHSYPISRGGLTNPQYTAVPYHANFINNQMLFNVYKPIEFDSVTLFTDDPGERIIQVFDNFGKLIGQKSVDLIKGKNQVYLGFHLEPSNALYTLTTDVDKNILSLGVKSPKLYRSDIGFIYPFFIEDKVRILSSDKGDSYYYYFYDWIIRDADAICVSERVEVPVVLIPSSTQDEKNDIKLVNYNNGRAFMIQSPLADDFNIELLSIEGKVIQKFQKIKKQVIFEFSVDLPGLYLISIKSEDHSNKFNYKWYFRN